MYVHQKSERAKKACTILRLVKWKVQEIQQVQQQTRPALSYSPVTGVRYHRPSRSLLRMLAALAIV
jgi:hypothetical protein